MSEWLSWFEAQPLFAICLTVAAYAVADTLWNSAGRPAILNPVLVATTILAGVLVVLGISYENYLRQAAPIAETLAVLVVLLAVPLCRQFWLIRQSRGPLLAGLVCGSVMAFVTALALPTLWSSGPELLATIAPKSSTTAVAVEVSERLGGLGGLTAVIVICSGIFGAAFGPGLLDAAGIRDERARGFALGVASHAIGTARAFQSSDTMGAFASLGMILNALLTLALAPTIVAIVSGQ